MEKLPKVVARRQKRKGQGYGSGKGGHTVGRGQKGQKARGKIGILFEGLKMKKSLLKRLPLQRGKGKFRAGKKPVVVNVKHLNSLPDGSVVDIALLVKNGLVKDVEAKKFGVKILGKGELKKKLTINLPMSKSVSKGLEKNVKPSNASK